MRRWMVRILLCLMLGAITTVAVAWAGATCRSWTSGNPTLWTKASGPWPAEVPAHWPDGAQVDRARGTLWSIDRFRYPRVDYEYQEFLSIDRLFFGWPCRSVGVERWGETLITRETATPYITRTAGHPPSSIWREGLPIAIGFHRLPLRPIWPGFVLDTLFYAAIWFGVFFAPGCAKRFIRTRRGRCPRCGYDLRGQRAAVGRELLAVGSEGSANSQEPKAKGHSIGCPECGWGREENAQTQKRKNAQTEE